MEGKVRIGKVINFGGALVAYLIGSGFASGQESLQFFTVYGPLGCLGAGLVMLALYLWFSTTIMEDGRKLQLRQSNEIFHYYCGKYLGTFFEWFTPVFLFMVFVVMIAGAGATLNEYYGLSPMVGRVGIALLSLLCVLMGLNRVIDIVGKIGPVIIVFSIVVGLGNIMLSPGGIGRADEILQTIEVVKAAPNWFISGAIFAAFGCVLAVPFLGSLGAQAASKKEAFLGGGLGAVMFAAACMVMAYGLMANLEEIYQMNVPALSLADKMFPAVGTIFSIVLIAGIFSTAVPMLWLSCNRVSTDEKSMKFRITAVVLTLIAFFGGQLPFARLVNIIYPFTGYLGLLLFICIFIRSLRNRVSTEKTAPAVVEASE